MPRSGWTGAAHDAWLAHMRVALDELGLAPEHEKQLCN
ncbi:hypothetical protein SMICM304S_02559 [Streptomyces microflavus]